MPTEVNASPPDSDRGLSKRYTIGVLLVLTGLLPWLLYGVFGALDSNSNDPRQWLPRGFEETDKYDWLQQHFGNDEITVVSWPGCNLSDPRAEQLAQTLVQDPETAYFQRATTGLRVLRQLANRPISLPAAEAKRRLQGILIGPNGSTTCVILTVSPRGVADRAAAVETIYRVAEESCGLDPNQLHLGGPTVDAATIDVESQRLLLELAALSGLIALLITWIRLRSFRLAAIAMVVAIYSTSAAMAILYYTGGNMNLVMTMLPPLIFVLSISSTLHLVNYYRDALEEGPWQVAPLDALRHGWRPCLLAAGTTAIGLLSLAVSEIVPVKMFGIYASTGMAGSLLVVLTLLPVALTVWRPRQGNTALITRERLYPGRIDRLANFIYRHHRAIVIRCLILMIATGAGLASLRSTVKLQYRFGSKSRILRDYRWLEENLGPLVPLEIVVRFPKTEPSAADESPEGQRFFAELQQVARMQRRVEQLPDVGATLSGADFAPARPGSGGVLQVTRRTMLRRRAEDLTQRLDENHFFSRDEQGNPLWRISIRASALSDVDYGRFVETLRQRIDPIVESLDQVDVTYTGVIPLIYKAQRELLSDLVESFVLAFAVIALVMIVALRDLRSGLLAMLPNILPAVVVFGIMGWFNIWIEIGSIMTASAAMGIAVDDTFHLLTWHRREIENNASHFDAMRTALHRCAGAMIHTTLVCACALLVFSLSSFMPIRRFSWLMAALLLAALVGDLLLLPALLVSPWGRSFCQASRRRASPSSLESVPHPQEIGPG